MQRAALRSAAAAAEWEKRLAAAVLVADTTSFNAIVADLRGACREAALRSTPRETEGVAALASALGKAALDGQKDAFARAEAELRSLCRRKAEPVEEVPTERELQKSEPDAAEPVFPWSALPFADGAAANGAALRSLEDRYAKLVERYKGDLNDMRLLRATLDLAGAYIKMHCLDKAELLLEQAEPTSRKLAGPWASRCIRDLAALRLEQGRQTESAALLEDLIDSEPASAALQRQLGTVYSAMGDTRRASNTLEEATRLTDSEPDEEDLWHQAVVRKQEGDGPAAIAMLLAVLQKNFSSDAVMLAKVQQSLADCYLNEGMVAEAIERYEVATGSFEKLVGTLSPLYGSAMQGLAESLAAAGRRVEAFEALLKALEVQARMDGIRPTPLYELLDLAEELVLGPADSEGEESEAASKVTPDARLSFHFLVPAVDLALTSLSKRGLDQDANGGVVLQKAAQALIYAADAMSGAGMPLRQRGLDLLRRARELMARATESGEVDLSELCSAADLQLELLQARMET